MANVKYHTPVKIPTFYDKEMLDEVRIKTINPMAEEVNKLSSTMSLACSDIIEASADVYNLKNRVSSLEGNGQVDLGPLRADINTNKNCILDLKQDLTALEDKVNSGGGVGGTDPLLAQQVEKNKQDITSIVGDVSDLKDSVSTNSDAISDLTGLVTTNTDSISTLDERVVALEAPEPEVTKFYVLPILGQSNGVGYGELPYDLNGSDNVHPRVKQLGRYGGTANGTASSDNINNDRAQYGDRWDELRPFPDCNLKVIPATPGLDHIQNLFQIVKGSTVGFGMYLAKMLLPYIPEDYGILLVPCARGGSAFTKGITGTYNASRLFCSENAQRQGVGTPLGNAGYDRVKYALELNPGNKLLPIIWVQGEFDAPNAAGHLTGFEEYFNWYKNKLITDKLDSRILGGSMTHYRWLCLGSTKWMLGCNLQKHFIKDKFSFDVAATRANIYDNYYYLSNKLRNADGTSPLVYVRIDVDLDGSFTETNRERGTGATTSGREIHFSTYANQVQLPRIIFNAICGHTNTLLLLPNKSMVSHTTIGDVGSVSTDSVNYVYDKPLVDFDMNDKLLVHQKWPTTSSGKLDNQVSGTGATLSGGSAATVVTDAKFGAVLRLPDSSNSHIDVGLNKGQTSYTKTIVFKPENSCRTSNSNLISVSNSGSDTDGLAWFVNGSLLIYPDYTEAQRASNFSVNPSVFGAWNGQFNEWQHLAITYNKNTSMLSVYLNGAFLGQVKSTTTTLGNICIGNYKVGALRFKGDIANYRVYDKCLSHGEIGTLWHCDLKNYL